MTLLNQSKGCLCKASALSLTACSTSELTVAGCCCCAGAIAAAVRRL